MLSQHAPGANEENYEKPQARIPGPWAEIGINNKKRTKLRYLSPQANYTDRAKLIGCHKLAKERAGGREAVELIFFFYKFTKKSDS
jgi:hypothetical protein